jgi:hypothetical protein
MEFEFDIVHVGGKDNEDADELSRQYVNAISVDWKEIADEQKADASLQEFKIKNPHCLHVKDGITYHRDEAGQLRLFVPLVERKKVWTELHDRLGYRGQARTSRIGILSPHSFTNDEGKRDFLAISHDSQLIQFDQRAL